MHLIFFGMLELAKTEKFQNVIIERNVKVCFDALNYVYKSVNSAITGMVSLLTLQLISKK